MPNRGQLEHAPFSCGENREVHRPSGHGRNGSLPACLFLTIGQFRRLSLPGQFSKKTAHPSGRSVDRPPRLEDVSNIQQHQKVLVMRRLFSFFSSLAALFIAVALTLIDIQTSSADEALVLRQKRAATSFGGLGRRHHGREALVVRAPVVGFVTSGRLTTALASRSGYSDPYYGYYGGPVYYGGPYYYRPYFDGAGPIYFSTHPIVEW